MSNIRNGRKLPKLGGVSAPHSYAEGTKIVKRKKTVRSAPPRRLNLMKNTPTSLANDSEPVVIGQLSPVNLSRRSSISSLDKIHSLYTTSGSPEPDLNRNSISDMSDDTAAAPRQRSVESPHINKAPDVVLSPVSITRKTCLDMINSRLSSAPPAALDQPDSGPRMISQASQVSPKVAFISAPPPSITVDEQPRGAGGGWVLGLGGTILEDEAECKPPSPPSCSSARDHLLTQSSARPSPTYQQPRKGVMASLARFGFVSAMHTAKQIKLVNETTVPLLFVVTSDLLARKIQSLNFSAGSSGVSGGVSMNSRGVIHQIFPLQARSSVEVQCRTDYNYLTIASRLEDGRFAVQRFQRQVQVGYVYTFSGNKMTHLDIRSPSFIEDLTKN